MKKNKRSVKVYGMCGYKSKLTPTIMLKGKWLSDFGFDVGSYISITCEDGKLIIAPDYDYILIDTPPSLGSLTINALSACDEVIIAVNPQLLAMMGLQDFLKTVKKIKNRLNHRLEIAGILLTMCDARTNLCKVITEQVMETFEGQIPIYESKIPNTVKVGESVYYSEPLIEYAPESKACLAYKNLAKEVIEHED